MGPPRPNVDIVFGVSIPSKDREAARCQSQGIFHKIGWDAHAQTIYPGPSLFQDFPRLIMMNFKTSVFQHM